MIEYALECLKKGWSVFPVIPNTKLPATSHGFKDSSTDISTIKAWWAKMPEANIGICTGIKSKILVVDVDVKKQARGKETIKFIRGLVPNTLTVITPSGGYHLYYSIDSEIKSRNAFMSGVDIKADGGYVVGPGSQINGKIYRYKDNFAKIAKISEALSWAIFNRMNKTYNPVNNSYCTHHAGDINISVSEGNWNDPILRVVARMVCRGYSDGEIIAKTESYTLPGWTIDQTHIEVQRMIDGARRKGFGKSNDRT